MFRIKTCKHWWCSEANARQCATALHCIAIWNSRHFVSLFVLSWNWKLTTHDETHTHKHTGRTLYIQNEWYDMLVFILFSFFSRVCVPMCACDVFDIGMLSEPSSGHHVYEHMHVSICHLFVLFTFTLTHTNTETRSKNSWEPLIRIRSHTYTHTERHRLRHAHTGVDGWVRDFFSFVCLLLFKFFYLSKCSYTDYQVSYLHLHSHSFVQSRI